MIKIAIDGPSGAGKSTLAKRLSKKLGFIYVDTGALYRAVGLYIFENSIPVTSPESIVAALDNIDIGLEFCDGVQKVYLNGRDVGDEIRRPEISMYASTVSAIPAVRKFLLDKQRDIAEKNNVIMDGRDIGTVIMPDAQVKIYLVSSAEKRAERRYKELVEKGIDISYAEVLSDMTKRDEQDSTRAASPALPAEDAVFLDNSGLTLDETLNEALRIVCEKANISNQLFN